MDTTAPSTTDQVVDTPVLQVEALGRAYGHGHAPAVDGVSFEVHDGEILALLGPSGCGKSTTLKCLGGLERPDSGRIRLLDRVLSDPEAGTWVPPEDRDMGFVFQSLALWPHRSAFQNVAYPLQVRKRPKAEVRERVMDGLAMVGCEHLADRMPSQLSGGEQQRVALVRALIHEPRVVLFDEPFSALDAALRYAMRDELLRIREQTQFTAIFVTHDQTEALMLGDRVAVMFSGQFLEIGAPQEVFEQPRTLDGARFLGRMNLLDGVVARSTPQGLVVETLVGDLVAADADVSTTGDLVVAGVRPHHVELSGGDHDPNRLVGRLVRSHFLGTEHHLWIDVQGRLIEATVPAGTATLVAAPGDEVACWIPPDAVRVYARGQRTGTEGDAA